MHDYWWYSELNVRSNSEEVLDKLNNYFEGRDLFLSAFFTAYDSSLIGIENTDSEADGDDDTLKELYQFVKSLGLKLEGFWLFESEGRRYRCEFNSKGEVIDADLDWLSELSVKEIKALKKKVKKESK